MQNNINICEKDQRLRELAFPLVGKWIPFILLFLSRKSHNFAELERAIDGISRKVLNENLINLQKLGLVEKKGKSSTGFPVNYELTELGKSSLVVLESLKTWLKENESILIQNRENYDKKKG
ncbi:winged helix-turn-helix transcriptional regulator [Carnobacterium maltaromaticum]|uniref:winged helix-turn-helix transcriptional regulator n=1 Tax=Carnobacterium maltaromaticum TaxID=2751 RepID=UPI0039BE9EF6